MSKKNPLVFLDVSIDGDPVERMVFELFSDVVPKTAENFRALCTGEKGNSKKTGRPLHYKGTFFHSIIKGSMAQGGDFLRREGAYGESIYGGRFPDESSKLKHDCPGLLSMAIADRDTRGSLFNITFKANHHLDRKYVVFGKLVQGHEVLKKIEQAGDEDGRPAVTVKIIYCGEIGESENQNAAVLENEKKKVNKLKMGKDASSEANSQEIRRRGKHKKSLKERRKKRRRYYTSESDSSSDSETETSESDSDSDSYISSSTDISSSSADKRRKRKRSSKRDKYRRGKRRDKRREKKRKRRDKRSKRRSKRELDGLSESGSGSSSEGNTGDVGKLDWNPKALAKTTVGNLSPVVQEREADSTQHKKGEVRDILDREEGEFPKENGEHLSNGINLQNGSDKSTDRQPDVVDDHPGKSRSRSASPKKTMSKSMSISPKKSLSNSQSVSPKRSVSKSASISGSPPLVSRRSRSISRSPVRSGSNRSPARSGSRSPVRGKRGKSINLSPVRGHPQRSFSRSPTSSPPRRSLSRSPPRTSSRKSSRKSVSRSPMRPSRRSISRSPVRLSRRSISRSPVRSCRRSISRSSGRAPSRRTASQSPVRAPARNNRRSYSRSPVSAGRRARSPISDHAKSSSRSPSPDGSSKRIRRGRGFSERFSFVRRYRSRSPDRSPVRSYRYGGRGDRDRYSTYRRSPRRYRSPIRGRTPPRYRSRRSRTRSHSVSRSPIRYRNRRYSRSPIRSRSPVDTSRYRASPRAERRRSPSRGRSPSRSRSSRDSQSPKVASKEKSQSRSSSGSPLPPGKKGLVSYGDGSPDSGQSHEYSCYEVAWALLVVEGNFELSELGLHLGSWIMISRSDEI
ncbi:unnamed protein product [Ilex paraguariensis]|uniref:peptidylprolyl isomerase n=1 Tax=Ilex paraguariensis TaxID=185542 RepID=A0ABC8U3F8_9AQUA